MIAVLDVNAARAKAVFVSTLQPSDKPSTEQIRFTITNMVRTYGTRWCAGRFAEEFGDHPDTAAARMRWARDLVAETYGRPAGNGCTS